MAGSVPSDQFQLVARFFLTLGIAAAGGFVMWSVHMPLPWLLGAIFTTAVAALLRVPLSVPAPARPPMMAVIGAMLGTSFQADAFANAGSWIVPLCGLVLYLLVSAIVSFFYFRRLAGLDDPTAYFAGLPGGVVEMVALGVERGGDERMIALVHSARILLVVSALPFLIQYLTGQSIGRGPQTIVPLSAVAADDLGWFLAAIAGGTVLGIVLRLPARFMLGPMGVSAILHGFDVTDFALPTVVLSIAQTVIGASIGSRFANAAPALLVKVLALSVGSTALLLATTLLFAWGASHLSPVPMEALVLAYSPGGLAEMSLVALTLHVDVLLVVLHHLVRVLLVVAVAGGLFRLLRPKTNRDDDVPGRGNGD